MRDVHGGGGGGMEGNFNRRHCLQITFSQDLSGLICFQ